MRIDWNGSSYYLGFQHDRFDEPMFHHGVWIKGKTVCTIEIGAKEAPILVGYGEAYCSENDRFEKELGRRMSLTRALESAFSDDREARKVFWAAYHDRRA